MDGQGILFERSVVLGGQGKSPKPYFMRIDGSDLKPMPENMHKRSIINYKEMTILKTIYVQAKRRKHLLSVKLDGSGERLLGEGVPQLIRSIVITSFIQVPLCSRTTRHDLCKGTRPSYSDFAGL